MLSKKFLLLLFAIVNICNVSARRKPPNACVDNMTAEIWDDNNDTWHTKKLCTLVQENPNVRCRKRRFRNLCPLSCGACPCRDRVAWKSGKATCKRIAKRVAKKGIEYCKKIPKARSQCQATCAKKCQP